LHEWVGRPLLLENFNYHPTDAYEYICESDTFNQLVKAIGCDMLLDLAHAQISARNMNLGDPRGYIEKFPLETVHEIHINRPFDDGIQMLDRHGPIGVRDLDLLRWTMARTPKLQAITLESHLPSEEALTEELRLIRTAV